MKSYSNSLIIVIVSCLITSCSGRKAGKADFNEQSFRETSHLSNGEIYKNDSLFAGNPRWIRFHPDSFLILQDMGTPKLVKIIDLKSNKVQEVAPHGRGPGETVTAWGIDIVDNDLYVFDGQMRKVIVYAPNNERKFQITKEFKLDERHTTSFYPLSKDLLVCLSDNGEKERLTLLNMEGKIVKKMGDYPPLLNSNGIASDNNIFYSMITGIPNGDKIVLACTSTDVLEIYNTETGLIRRIQGPVGIQLTVTKKNIGIGYMLHTDPRYATYGMADANANEFWVEYSGYKAESEIRPSTGDLYPKRIFCFDWEGNPIRILEFDYPVITFDVDWNNKILYSLILKDNYTEIASYSLINILK